MSKASEALQRRFGQNLSESLGVRNGPGASTLPPLPSRPPGESFPRETGPDDGRTRARDAGHMELSRIVPDPDQPRKEFTDEAIERLSASLLKHGQLQPIRVRWNVELGKWVVISGERRYRAAVRAGLKTVACIFTDEGLSPTEILQEQIVENLLREDLKPIEQARAYRQLMDLHSWTAKELSGELSVSQGAISKSLSLLNLPEDIQAEVDRGALPATTAYEVAKVTDPASQRDVARRIVAEGLTRDAATEVVRSVSDRPARTREPRTKGRTVPPPGSLAPQPNIDPSAGPGNVRTIRTAYGKVVVTSRMLPLGDHELIEVLAEALLLVRTGQPQAT